MNEDGIVRLFGAPTEDEQKPPPPRGTRALAGLIVLVEGVVRLADTTARWVVLLLAAVGLVTLWGMR